MLICATNRVLLDIFFSLFYNFTVMIDLIAQKLNKISSETEALFKGESSAFTRFLFGDEYSLLASVIKRTTVRGKVAAVYSERSFKKHGAKVTSIIRSEFCSVGNVVLSDSILSVEDVGAIISAAEDARCIVCFDCENFGAVTYAASVVGVPAALVVDEFGFYDVLPTRAILKNGSGWEYVKTSAPRYVIADEKTFFGCDVAGAYASVLLRLTDFTDYRVKRALQNDVADKRSYSLMKSAVSSAYSAVKLGIKERAEKIIECKLIAESANVAARGALSDFSASRNAARICYMSGNVKESRSVYILKKILGVYDLYFSGEYDDILEIPDYLARADKLAEIAGSDDYTFMAGIKKQRELCTNKKSAEEKLKVSLKDEIKSQNQIAASVIKTYFALGGKDSSNKAVLNAAVKYGGDLPDTFNCMSLVRESGITEYIRGEF